MNITKLTNELKYLNTPKMNSSKQNKSAVNYSTNNKFAVNDNIKLIVNEKVVSGRIIQKGKAYQGYPIYFVKYMVEDKKSEIHSKISWISEWVKGERLIKSKNDNDKNPQTNNHPLTSIFK